MKPENSLTSNAARCSFRTPTGRQCRLAVSHPRLDFCPRHLPQKDQHHPVDLSSTLIADSEGFATAVKINQSLGGLYTLLAQDRIAPRRAAVLAYISSLLLRTLPVIAAEQRPEESPTQFILDITRPIRD